MKRRLVLTAIAGVAALTVAAPAWAYWATTGSSTVTATAATLSAPTTATVTPVGTEELDITVTGASAPSASAYRVMRGTAVICSSVALNTPCQDAGLSPSTAYSYAVYGLLGNNWVSSASLSVSGTTNALPALTFTSSSTTCPSGGVALGNGNKTWSTKVSVPSAVGSPVTVTVADNHNPTVSTTVTITAGDTESSTGGNVNGANNGGRAQFTLGQGESSLTVTASASGYASVTCTLTH